MSDPEETTGQHGVWDVGDIRGRGQRASDPRIDQIYEAVIGPIRSDIRDINKELVKLRALPGRIAGVERVAEVMVELYKDSIQRGDKLWDRLDKSGDRLAVMEANVAREAGQANWMNKIVSSAVVAVIAAAIGSVGTLIANKAPAEGAQVSGTVRR